MSAFSSVQPRSCGAPSDCRLVSSYRPPSASQLDEIPSSINIHVSFFNGIMRTHWVMTRLERGHQSPLLLRTGFSRLWAAGRPGSEYESPWISVCHNLVRSFILTGCHCCLALFDIIQENYRKLRKLVCLGCFTCFVVCVFFLCGFGGSRVWWVVLFGFFWSNVLCHSAAVVQRIILFPFSYLPFASPR